MFTPLLGAIYGQLKSTGKKVEIVYVSSDKSEQEFDEYFVRIVPYCTNGCSRLHPHAWWHF